MDNFLQRLKRWSITCYTDRLLANQIAGKPVCIGCHIIKINIESRKVLASYSKAFQHSGQKHGHVKSLTCFVIFPYISIEPEA